MDNLFHVTVIKANKNLFEDALHVSEDVLLHADNGIVDLFPVHRFEDKVDEFVINEVFIDFDNRRIIHLFQDVDFLHGFPFGCDVTHNYLHHPRHLASLVHGPSHNGRRTSINPSRKMILPINSTDISLYEITKIHVQEMTTSPLHKALLLLLLLLQQERLLTAHPIL